MNHSSSLLLKLSPLVVCFILVVLLIPSGRVEAADPCDLIGTVEKWSLIRPNVSLNSRGAGRGGPFSAENYWLSIGQTYLWNSFHCSVGSGPGSTAVPKFVTPSGTFTASGGTAKFENFHMVNPTVPAVGIDFHYATDETLTLPCPPSWMSEFPEIMEFCGPVNDFITRNPSIDSSHVETSAPVPVFNSASTTQNIIAEDAVIEDIASTGNIHLNINGSI